MKNVFKDILYAILTVLGWVAGLIAVCGVIWCLTNFELVYTKYFAPKFAEVKHETWSNTTTRIDGMVRQLSDLKFEYDKADDDVERNAITSRIRIEFANFDSDKITNHTLRQFLNDVMSGNLN